MERIKVEGMPVITTYLSDTCDKHRYVKDGVEHIKKVQLMNIEGQAICPLCESDKRKQELEDKQYEIHKDIIEHPDKQVFFRESMVTDETILKARFENFKQEVHEEKQNLQLAKVSVKDFLNEIAFTLWMQGKPGAGKSHLAYSIAYGINEVGKYKVLFIEMSELMKSIKATFNNKSDETEQSIIKKLTSVDVLVLDDVGAEVGNIDTQKEASDFVGRVMKDTFNGRQGKTTICTTNLTGGQLKQIYDAKTFSRMFRDYRYIKFENSKDRRFIELPF
ncbi:ATP-binding protein [Bacillus sp. JJ722]|uniref:ATP-binding protein n=1 Tax=Bacillus sp. JJ722 TaxID=3122973 RepID=UPI003000E982